MASIRKHRDKFQVQVRRKGSPAVSRTFSRLSDAKEWARHMEALADRQDLPTPRRELSRMPLGELVRRYLAEVVVTKRGAHIETFILSAFLRHPICQKPLADLSTADFVAYRDERLETITAKSLQRQLSPLSNMFEVAVREWGISMQKNPLRDLTLKTNDNRRERRVSKGELGAIIKAAKACRNPLILPMIQFALETGMRRGEILGLRWGDIDLERATAKIALSKNGYSRTIPLTATALSIVTPRSEEDASNSLVFPTTAMALKLAWNRIVRRANIEDLHFHDLRHEAVSRFFEVGLTVPEVASISGHRDPRMLFRYAHANQALVQEKLKRLGPQP